MDARASTRLRHSAARITLIPGISFAGASTARVSAKPVATPTCGSRAHAAAYRTVQYDAGPAVSQEVKAIDREQVPAVEEVSHVYGDGAHQGKGRTTTGKTWTIEDSAGWTEYERQRMVIDGPAVPSTAAVPPVTHEETVAVHLPKRFKPSEYAAGADGRGTSTEFQVTGKNGTSKTFDPSVASASVSSGGGEVDQIFYDHVGRTPGTKVHNGKTVKYTTGLKVLNPKNISMELSRSFEHYPANFTHTS